MTTSPEDNPVARFFEVLGAPSAPTEAVRRFEPIRCDWERFAARTPQWHVEHEALSA